MVSCCDKNRDRKLAEELLKHIRNSSNRYIRGFNAAVPSGSRAVRRWFRREGYKYPTVRAPSILRRVGCKLGKRVVGKALIVAGVAASTKVTADAIEDDTPIAEAVALEVVDYISPVSPEDIKRAGEEFDSWLEDSEVHENLLEGMGIDFGDDPLTEFLK